MLSAGCPNCGETATTKDEQTSLCAACGFIFDEVVSEVSFGDGPGGSKSANEGFQSNLVERGFSQSVGTVGYGRHVESRQLTIAKGNRRLKSLGSQLEGISTQLVEGAQRLFLLALQNKFLQGRKHDNVIATCLYVACRRDNTPHMLIDFSDAIQTNLYVLGSTFLKFIRALKLTVPIIDPSLYIRRFASQLEFESKTNEVAMTALRLVSRMKRDWLQVGRRPSGICGAALLVAARIHGFKRSQQEITRVVCVAESTLRKRLLEFSLTPAGGLTVSQFGQQDIETSKEENPPSWNPSSLLENKDDGSETKKAITAGTADAPAPLTTTYYPLAPLHSSTALDTDNHDEAGAETFSDLDEDEIDTYILGQREKDFKERQWQILFADWLAEQEQKKLGMMSDQALGYVPTKKRPRAKAIGLTPSDTAAEATMKMLKHTGRSAKIDYEALKELFDDSSFLDAPT